MKIVKTIEELQKAISRYKSEGRTIGFVPTMGALHEGHLSLLEACNSDGHVCVLSIFVNPTQFNNTADLKHYPRTWEKDIEAVEGKVQVVFAPSVEEMYPEQDSRVFDFGNIERVMEGKHRPGHFNGVAQIVSKLFDAVQPEVAYFGDKDFQQVAIVKAMVKQLNYAIKIVPCPIIREEDGLAMSSRNTLLSAELRQKATIINKALAISKNLYLEKDIDTVKRRVVQMVNEISPLEVEYFEIVNEDTLEAANAWDEPGDKVGCIAVFAGNVRLIDNIRYKK